MLVHLIVYGIISTSSSLLCVLYKPLGIMGVAHSPSDWDGLLLCLHTDLPESLHTLINGTVDVLPGEHMA